jgi:hypothetical protein
MHRKNVARAPASGSLAMSERRLGRLVGLMRGSLPISTQSDATVHRRMTYFANLTTYAIYRCKARVTASGSEAITLRRTRAGPAGRRWPCS